MICAYSDARASSVFLVLFLALVLLMPSAARAEDMADAVGSVKTATGQAYVCRGTDRFSAKVGDHLFQGDTLVTAARSSMGVIFRDDTILSLGSGSEMVIDEFAFDPSKESMKFLVRMGRGTAQFITGQMAKLSPENMHVETPLSTIGIRGTRFLVKVD
ncbi:FecR family protein [Pseudodesulfovibrio portus]|uniref:FecR protein domain-containing protein n=1 Tax=Pseudodesulfovibrio portus TaxID=231439 RepID=A0ABM8ATG2_9BACT|nr:FecR domain-containing protein [Pseudodesulfovibrio portus]BDQ34552.1 hypothetical protein JCM14722_20940 [Pseudodesulfovibrio portus]